MESQAQQHVAPQGAGRQIIHSDYVDLMRRRAIGELPDMGCALRLGEVIAHLNPSVERGQPIGRLLDVGCATGHYYRTFRNLGIDIGQYVGLEIDEPMVSAAREAWSEEISRGRVKIVLDDVESETPLDKCDVLVCANSFMYYKSAKRVLRKFLTAARQIIVRSYFAESSFRIIRVQSAQNNDSVDVDELDVFADSGDILVGDFWNIYGFSYIERLVTSIEPRAKVQWLEDRNKVESMAAESGLGVVKRGGTQVVGGYEISYPLLQPWEILVVTVG